MQKKKDEKTGKTTVSLTIFSVFAQVDVFFVLAPCLALLDVHDADEGHGPTPHQQDGEEHDDYGGGADQLPLLYGLQAQMKTECVWDRTPQTWASAQRICA